MSVFYVAFSFSFLYLLQELPFTKAWFRNFPEPPVLSRSRSYPGESHYNSQIPFMKKVNYFPLKIHKKTIIDKNIEFNPSTYKVIYLRKTDGMKAGNMSKITYLRSLYH